MKAMLSHGMLKAEEDSLRYQTLKHDLFSRTTVIWFFSYIIFCFPLQKLPKYSNSVASLAFNHTGELLAVASSHTYQEANEK